MTRPGPCYITRHLLPSLAGPIQVIDAGARDSLLDPLWVPIASKMHLIGFEPNIDACIAQQRQALEMGISTKFIPSLLGRGPHRVLLGNNAPGGASVLEQNLLLTNRWKFENIDGQVTMAADYFFPDSNDTIYPESSLKGQHFDFLKMNIQGVEDNVLRYASYSLDNCLAVLTEVSFVESYKVRCMFHEVDEQLRSRGFEFFGFHSFHEVGRRASPFTSMRSNLHTKGYIPGGQLIEAHAIYLRDLPQIANASPSVEEVNKLIILAELLGQVEYAFELLDHFGASEIAECALADYSKHDREF